jgi:hypothetical protein
LVCRGCGSRARRQQGNVAGMSIAANQALDPSRQVLLYTCNQLLLTCLEGCVHAPPPANECLSCIEAHTRVNKQCLLNPGHSAPDTSSPCTACCAAGGRRTPSFAWGVPGESGPAGGNLGQMMLVGYNCVGWCPLCRTVYLPQRWPRARCPGPLAAVCAVHGAECADWTQQAGQQQQG